MTVQEAKESIEYLKMQLTEDLEMICFTGDELKALDMSIQALEEVEQYRAIAEVIEDFDNVERETLALALEELKQCRALGTVEELKVAMEKQVAKKPLYDGDIARCPMCSEKVESDYCSDCGQKIDRSEEE